MKIAVLTTQTPHHAYFVRELQGRYGRVSVFCETGSGSSLPGYETFHPFERERDAYERALWFDGRDVSLSEWGKVESFPSLNDRQAVAAMAALKPDITIDFGTGPLKAPFIEACPAALFNLHGADPQMYRGLDTHLWAIFHNDFGGLVTTLHCLDAGLDTGDIVLQSSVPLDGVEGLHQLRAANTRICVRLACTAIDAITREEWVPRRPQGAPGRYYTAMPAALKELCQRKFARYLERRRQ